MWNGSDLSGLLFSEWQKKPNCVFVVWSPPFLEIRDLNNIIDLLANLYTQ